jgi:hypothetical protein
MSSQDDHPDQGFYCACGKGNLTGFHSANGCQHYAPKPRDLRDLAEQTERALDAHAAKVAAKAVREERQQIALWLRSLDEYDLAEDVLLGLHMRAEPWIPDPSPDYAEG